MKLLSAKQVKNEFDIELPITVFHGDNDPPPDPHVLGSVADLIGTDHDTLKRWLNDDVTSEQQHRKMERK